MAAVTGWLREQSTVEPKSLILLKEHSNEDHRGYQESWLIHLKGALFLVMGLDAGSMLLVLSPTIRTATLLLITVWAFCRFYYYLFYVLDRYLGRGKRFAGVFDALRYLIFNPRRKDEGSHSP